MSKIKLKHTIQILDESVNYKEVLKEVKNLKTKIETKLKEEGLENEFEIIIEVENDVESFSFIPPLSV